MQLTSSQRQKIYDRWHKESYQVNIERSIGRWGSIHKDAIKHLSLNNNSRLKLLDFACGKGLFLKELRAFNNKLDLYGVDISKVAIDSAKKIVDSDLRQCDGERMPFKDNFFDRIISLGGLEYLQDPVAGAAEISRVLSKKGIAVFFVPNLMFIGYIWLALRHGAMPTHGGSSNNSKKVYYDYSNEKFFTHEGWKDVLAKGNLSVVKSYTYTRIGSTRFASSFILWLYNKIFYRIIPFNLSYSFIFICKKSV